MIGKMYICIYLLISYSFSTSGLESCWCFSPSLLSLLKSSLMRCSKKIWSVYTYTLAIYTNYLLENLFPYSVQVTETVENSFQINSRKSFIAIMSIETNRRFTRLSTINFRYFTSSYIHKPSNGFQWAYSFFLFVIVKKIKKKKKKIPKYWKRKLYSTFTVLFNGHITIIPGKWAHCEAQFQFSLGQSVCI